jgi:hypothetical protein
MSTKLSRRHFIISGAAALGACFLPIDILRRARQYQLDNDDILIEAPETFKHTLYANYQDDGVWQFSLDQPGGDFPDAKSWKWWLKRREHIDVTNHRKVTAWAEDNEHYSLSTTNHSWLDDPVDEDLWGNYIEWDYAIRESPEARALSYLSGLDLGNGPVSDPSGREIGRLDYYFGPHPGSNWHFAQAEGELVLPALQHRLRELGESTKLEI